MTISFSPDQLLTVAEAARFLGIGRKMVYQLIDFGQLTPVRLGKSLRLPVDDLVAFQTSGQLT